MDLSLVLERNESGLRTELIYTWLHKILCEEQL